MKNIMIVIFLIISSGLMAQTIGYTYRPLAAEGCNMKYSIARQGAMMISNSQ